MFSIIQSRYLLDGVRVLDICAGTGALGIEALSRGAASACFIDKHRDALTALEKNLHICGFQERTELLRTDALSALKLLATRHERFDLVFFDPPYASTLYTTIPPLLVSSALLSQQGVLVIESASRSPLPELSGFFTGVDHRVYGDTAIDFLTLEEP